LRLKPHATNRITNEKSTCRQGDELLDAITLAVLLGIGGIQINPGPNQYLRNQL
jgi:hypothetical protein